MTNFSSLCSENVPNDKTENSESSEPRDLSTMSHKFSQNCESSQHSSERNRGSLGKGFAAALLSSPVSRASCLSEKGKTPLLGEGNTKSLHATCAALAKESRTVTRTCPRYINSYVSCRQST